MDEAKQKLRRAKEAMQSLQSAIAALENPGKGPADPDYDLWRAWQLLDLIEREEKMKENG